MLKSKVYFGPVFDKAHGLYPKMGDLSIPSEWAPSKLSENHRIVEF